MAEFEFDIQRFASSSVGTAAQLSTAIKDLSTSGDTITLTADIDVTQTLNIPNIANAAFVIDLNKHKLTYKSDGRISIPRNTFVMFKNGTITSDTGVTVTIEYSQSAAPTFSSVKLDDDVSKKVTVRTATELISAIKDLDGTDTTIQFGAAISDPANFTVNKSVTIDLGNNTLGYSSDHTIKIAEGAEVTFTATGGSISPASGVDVIIEYADKAPTMSMAASKYSGVVVAKVVEVSTADDLKDAVNDLNGTDTIIRLTADIENAPALDIEGAQTVVFDMNDHSIAYSDDGEITIDKASTVKFKNGGSITAKGDDASVNIDYYQSNSPTFGNTKLIGDDISKISKTVKVSSYAELNAALNALDGTKTTIQLTQNITNGSSLIIPANQNVTIDLNYWTYTMSVNNSTITVGRDSYVTITGGSIVKGSNATTAAINNGGNLTFDDMTLNGVSVTTSTGTVTTKGSTVTLSSTQTYVDSPTIYTATSGTIVLTFDNNDGDASVKELATGATFTARNGADTVEYTRANGGIEARRNGVLKIYRESKTTVPMTELAFTDDNPNLVEAVIMESDNTNFKFQASTMYKITQGEEFDIVSYYDYTSSGTFGKIKKIDERTFSLSDKNSSTWTTVTINDGYTVEFSSDFKGTEIIIGDTTFRSITGGTSFTVSSDNSDYVSIFGANASLTTGTIQTATYDQTIAAGKNSVGGYSGGKDGINVIISGTNTLVSDIDDGESFNVNGVTYTKGAFGLTTSDTLDNIFKLYTGPGYETITSGVPATIDLSTLEASMREFITPSASASAILTLGGANNYSAVVLNYSDSALGDGSNAVKFAELKVSDDKKSYVLDTIDGGNIKSFRNAVDTIYVDGVNATLDAVLVGAKDTVISNKTMTIETRMGTRFIVTESQSNFSVNGNIDDPTVIGANKITLLEGTITTYVNASSTANNNTVITVGEGGPQLKSFSDAMTVTLRESGEIFVKGSANDEFVFKEKTYKILSGDGMTFKFDAKKNDYLVFSELDATDNDAFQYDGKTYSVKGAGFIRIDGNDTYMWRGGNSLSPHGLSGGSVAVADLTNNANWGAIALVSTVDGSINLPLGTDTITLVGADYNKVYGVFSGANGDYTLDGVTETVNTANLGKVTVQGGMKSLSATEKLTNVTIYSPAANFAVTDDNGDGWVVKLDGSAVSAITSNENITLLSGTFQVDSDTDVNLAVNNSIISAGDSSTIIVTGNGSDATISGLGKDESFNIVNRGDYTMKAVGLVKDDQYLFGSKDGVVPLSDISTYSLWGALISASALTINSSSTNAIIVDATENTIYADLVVDGTTISMRKADGGYPWDSSNIIYVDNTLVGFTDDFTGSVSIAGIQSKATVNVTEINPFTFKDAGTGAVIANVNAYNLTGGLVTVKTEQTVSAAAGTLSADGGNGVTFNVGGTSADSATIGALDTGDTITVNDNIYSVFNVGIMTDSDELLRDTKSQKSITVQELDNTEKIKTITVTDSVLAVSQTIAEGASYVAIDPGRNTRYGMISVVGGDFSMWKDPLDTAWNSNYTISADNQRVTLTTDYLNKNLYGVKSGARFQVFSLSSATDSNFSFYDAYTGGATLSPQVASVKQTAGLIALNDNQSIFFGSAQTKITDTDIDGKSNIAVSVNAGAATITALDSGDVFSINGTSSYGLLSNGRMVRINDNKIYSGKPIETKDGSIAVNTLLGNNWNDYHSIKASADDVLTIGASAVYDLTRTGDAAFIVGDKFETVDSGGVSFPTEIYGTLTYTGSVYSLTTEGKSKGTSLKGVVVTSDAQPVEFSTVFLSLPITVGSASSSVAEFAVTDATASFTVNYAPDKVSVSTVASAISLTGGMLYINDPIQTVTAGGKTIVTNSPDSLSVNYSASTSTFTIGAFKTAGEAVTVNGTPYTLLGDDGFDIIVGSSSTTLDGVDVGDTFNVGSTSYIMTSIGLATNDQTKLHKTIQSPTITSFTTDTLASSYWNTIYSAPDGVLTIAADNRPYNAQVVDLSDPTNAATYGYINYSGGVHTFTYGGSSSSDIKLTSISIGSSVVANLDSNCSDLNITAPNATLIASASSHFIVNAQSTYASVGAPITLTAGTVQGGYSSNPVTVQGKVIAVTNNTKTVMTVGINGSGSAFVGGLDDGDTFTINGINYVMKTTGLFRNGAERVYNYTDTFIIDDEDARKIINVSGTSLSLRGENDDEDALVYNASNTTRLGSLSVGSVISLTGLSSSTPNNIKDIYIEAQVFSVDFATKVHSPKGIVTVNENMYNGVGDIVISAVKDDSSLYGGMVALESGDTVKSSNDTLEVVSGNVSASAALGNFTYIYGLDAGESFTFGGYTYTQTDVGLMRGDGTISEALSSSTVKIGGLSIGKFVEVLAVVNGDLDLTSVSSTNANVYDSNTAPTAKYATLTRNGTTRYTLTDSGSASTAIETVDISTGTTLTANFVTNVSTSAAGTVTVNGKNYVGNTALTVKSDGTDSTLYDGTLTLDATKTATNSAVADATLKAVSGSISATANNGSWTELGDIANDESFELGGITYTQKGMGLTKGGTSICENIAGGTIYIADLNDATFTSYVTTDKNNVLALTNATVNANVYNNDVTAGFGKVTVSGASYTFDYAGLSVRSAVGNSVTVNGAAYTGATALTILTTDDSSKLYEGTASITSSDTVTAGDITVNGVSGTITATAGGGSWTRLGSLDSGDEFTVDGTTYRVQGTDLFELVSGSPGKLYDGSIRNGSISYKELSSDFSTIYTLTDGILDLTATTFDEDDQVIVVESASALTTRIAYLTYTGGGYSLGEHPNGMLTNFDGVKLGSNARVLNTELETTVFTEGNTTYTINGASFVALEGLSIATADNSATLSDGKVSLRENYSVTVTGGDAIKSTTGTVTVDVDGSNVTVGALNNADVFSVNGTSYLKTSIGLATGDITSLNTAIAPSAKEFTTDNLAASNWIQIYQADGGALSITTSTPKNARVVDLSTPGNAVTYGTLTYSGVGYGLTIDNTSDKAPTSVDIGSGVIATLPAECSDNQITAGGASFTASASSPFTVDVRSTYAIVSAPITLTAGTVQASIGAAVTAQSKVITATSDTKTAMTVGINSDSKVFVGGLDAGDSFTIDGESYIMKSTGLFKNGTERVHDYTATFWLDEEISANVINVSGTNLDLTNQTDHALVYNSGNTLQLGSLSVIGNEMTLSGLSNAPANIKTVDIAANTDLTVDFATKVNAPSGTVTVNDNQYTAVGSIVIDATADDSSLYGGTVVLESGDTLAATNGDTVNVGTGPINVTAALGKVTQFSELGTGDSFSFGGKSYVQADMGLMLGDQICESLNGSFTAANLNNGKFVDILTPVDGGLDFRTITADANIYDDADSPAVKYAALTVSRDNTRYTLTDSGSASTAIETVDITAGKILTVDFSTMVNAPTGTVTVNGDRYNAAGSIVLSAVKNDSTLYDGIVTLDKTNPTASATYNGSLTVSNASISATATLGYFTAISGLDTGESFTFDGTTYTQTDIGLRNGSFVAEALSGSEIALDDLETVTWNNFLTVGSDGVLTLADVETDDANVYNYAVTARLGTVTKSGSTYTLDYAGKVRATAGSLTVNGAAYTALNTIIIDTTPTTSTLTTGTVNLASGDSVATTSNHNVANTAGDGLTVNASGSAVTFGALNSGDSFTADDVDYQITDAALFNTTAENIYTATSPTTITLAKLTSSDNWNNYLTVTNQTLDVTDSSLSTGSDAVIVSDDLSKVFGTLANESGVYKFTANDLVNGALSSINIVDTAATFDDDFADVETFTANDSTFADVTVNTRAKTFTLTATDDVPRFSDDVKSFTLTAGEVQAVANQTVTAGNHVITPSTVASATISLDDISGLSVGDTFTLDGDTYTYVANLGLFNTTDTALVTDGFADDTLTFGFKETQVLAPVDGVLDLSNVTNNNMLVFDSATAPTKQLGTVTKSDNVYTLDYAGKVRAAAGTVTVNGNTYTGTTTLIIDTTTDSSTLTTGTVSLASGDSVNTTSEHNIANTAGDGLTVNASTSAVTIGELNSGDTFTADDVDYQLTDAALFNTTAENIYTETSPTSIALDTLTDSDDWNNYLTVTNQTLDVTDNSLSTGEDAVIVSDDLSTVFGTLSNESGVYKFTADKLVNGALNSINIVDTAATFDDDFADVATFTANDSTFADVTVNTRAKTFTLTATDDVPRFSDDVKSFTLTAGEVQAVAGQTVTAGSHVITPSTVANAIISLDDISGLSVGDTFTLDGDTYTYVDNLGLFNTTDTALVTDGFADDTLTLGFSETQALAPVDGILDLSGVTKDNMLVFDSATAPTKQLGTVTKSGSTYTLDYAGQVRAAAGTVTVNGNTYTGTTTLIIDTTPTTSTLTTGTVNLASGDSVATTSEHAINNTAGDGLTVNASGSAVTFGELNSGDAFTADDVNYQLTDAALFNTTDENIYTETSPTSITLDTLTGDDDWNNYITVENGTLNITDALLPTADADDESDGSEAASESSEATSDVDNDAVIVSDDLSNVFGTLANENGVYKFTADSLVNGALSSINIVDTAATFDDDFADVATFTANDSTFAGVTVNTRAKTFTLTATDDVPRFSDDVKSFTLTAGEVQAVANQTVTAGNHVITPTTVASATISLDDISGLSVGDTFTLDGDTYTYVSNLGLFNTTDTALVTDGFADDTLTFGFKETQVLAPVDGILDLSNVTKDNMLVFDSATAPTKQLGTVTKSDNVYTLDYAGKVRAAAGTVTVNGNTYTGTTTLIIDTTTDSSTLTTGTVSLASGDSVNTTSEHNIANTAGDGLTVNASGSAVTFGELNSGDAFTADDVDYQITDAALFNTTAENIYTETAPTSITLETLTDSDDWNNYLTVENGTLNITDALLPTADADVYEDADDDDAESDGSESSEATSDVDNDAVIVSDDLSKVFGTLANENGVYKFTADKLVNGALSSINIVDTAATFDDDFADVETFTANDSTFADVTVNTRAKTFTLTATDDVPRFSDDVKSFTLTAGEVQAVAGQTVTAGSHVITPTTVANATISLDDISGLSAGDTFTLDGDTYTYVDKLGLFNTTDTALVTDGFSDGTLNFGFSETQVLAPVDGVLDLSNVTKNNMLVFDSATAPTKQLGTVTKNGTSYTLDYAGQVRAAAGTVTVNGNTYTGTTTLIIDTTPTTSTLTTGTVNLASGDFVATTSEHAINNTAGDGLTVNASGSAVTIGELNSGDSFTADSTAYQITDAALFNTTAENIYTATSPTSIALDTLTDSDDWNNYLTVENGTLNITDAFLPTADADDDDESEGSEAASESSEATSDVDNDAVIVSDDLSKVFGTLANENGVYKFTANDLVNGALSSINIVDTAATFDDDFADVETFTANDSTFADVTVGTRTKTFTLTATGDVPRFSDDVKSFTLTAGEVQAVAGQTVTAGSHVITPTTVANATISLDDISGLSVGDTFTLDGDTYTYVDNLGLFNTTDTALVTDGFSDDTLTFGFTETQVLAPVDGILDLSGVTANNMLVFDSATAPTKQLGTVTKSGTSYTLDYAGQVRAPSGTVTVNGATYTGTTTLIIDTTVDSSTLTTGTVSLASGDSVATTSEHNIANTAGDGLTVNASGSAVTIGELNSGDAFTADSTAYQITDAALFNTTDENIYTETSPTTITLDKLTGDDDWNNYLTVTNQTLDVTDNSLSTGSDAVIVSDDLSKVFGTLANENGVYKFTANDLVNGALSSINIVDTAATFDDDFADVATFTANDSTFADVTVNTRAKTFTLTATDDVPRFSDDVKSFTLTAGEVQAVAGQTVTAGSHVITPTTVANAIISLDDISGLSVGDTFTLDGDTYTYVSNLGLFNTTDTALVTDGFSDDTLTFGFSETQALAPVDGILDLSNVTNNNMLVFDSATNPTERLGTVTKSDNVYTLDYAGQVRAAAGTVTVNGATYTGTTTLIIDTTVDSSTLTTGTVNLASGSSVATTSEHAINATAGDGLTVNASGSAVTIGELNSGDAFTADSTAYQITDAALFNTTDENIYTETSPTTITLDKLTGDDDWNNYLTVANGTLNVTDSTLSTGSDAVIVSDDLSKVFGTLANENGVYKFTADSLVNGALSLINIVDTAATFDDDFADVATFTANDSTFADVTVNTRAKTFTLTATDDVPRFSDDVKSFTLTAGEVQAVANQTVTAGSHVITPTTVANATISLDDISGLSVGDTFTLDGDNYTYVDNLGLFNTTDTALVTDGFSDGTLNFGFTETQVLAPVDGVLDLDDVTNDSMLVFDSATAPTKQLGTVTKNGTSYTLDYAGKVRAAAGSLTVNGATYTGTTTLIIDTTPTTSTLTTGTVSLSSGDSVATTSEHNIANTAGDGLTVNASGSAVTIGELNSGDSFTADDNTYTVAVTGPMNSAGALWRGGDYSDGLTIDALETASNWRTPLVVSNKDLFVDTGTLVNGEEIILTNSTTSPTEIYGTLSRDSDGRYKLTVSDGDTLLSALTVSGVVMDVDNDLASDDVNITTVNADNTETLFTVSPKRGTEYFTVDATGNIPKIEDAGSVEITDGKLTTGDDIPVTIADDAQNPTIVIGNGTHKIGNQTVTLADNDADADVTLADDGTISSISPLTKDATVTIDGDTYTSPADNSTLNYNDADGWYFDDYIPESGAYIITVDKLGNVTVDRGVKFTDVVSSGHTLPTNSTIQLAADVNYTPVTLINNGATAINLTDAEGNSLVANLGKIGGVLFDGDGAEFDSLEEAHGATFTLDEEQSLTAGTTVITANADDVTVTIGRRNRLTIQGDISAVNATIDLSTSDTIKFDGMSLSGDGTAIFDGDGDLSITDGTTATKAKGKTFTVYGTVTVDGKTVNAATSAALTATAKGLTVGKTALTVTGDDAYTVNIDANSSITGVENLGSATGVTVGGLTNGTLLTDAAGALTVDKTFASGASVLYTVRRGKVTAADGVTTISGDFANGVAVNETPYTISGGTVTIDASTGNVAADAGTYDVNGKTYTTSTQTTFTLSDGTVKGAALDGDGNFAIHQDESDFSLDDDTLNLSGNSVVTLGVASDNVIAADGVEEIISGLGTATVNDIGDATINGTAINVDGDTVTALVANGTVTALTGADDGATITSAPNMTITAGNGSYNFPNGDWTINDTLDGSADFLTDGNSNVIGVDNIAGSINGASGSVTINDADFGTTSDNVTVTTDGTDITGVYGLSSGDSVGGSLSQVTFTLPEGGFTVNGAAFTLSGDDNVQLTDDGKTIDGMDNGAIITLGSAGEYAINGTSVTAEAGDVYGINRDGFYKADADNMPITEGTPYANILALGASSRYVDESASGAQSITLGNRDEVALIDSPDAPTNVTTGNGNDSVVVRHGAEATVDTANGDNTLIVTNGRVTLENYSASNASVKTFDYSNVPAAVRNNSIKFGDGVMTLGDGVITFDGNGSVKGATLTEIVDATGNGHNIGFTHTAGGTLNTSAESANYLHKGNYAEKTSDTQKSAGSSITGGRGNDTLLIGANDYANAGGGNNQIYITDASLRSAAATIVLSDGNTNVRGFNGGFNTASDVIRVNDLSALEFGAGNAGLTMTSGDAQMTFDDLTPELIDVSGVNNSMKAAGGYELKVANGSRNYNVAVAQDGQALAVTDAADIYYGNANGLSFTEYAGTVQVNLANGTGTIGGTASTIKGGATKLAAGTGDATLTGSDGNETLYGGLGNATLNGGAGADLMIGNTSSLKSGSTKFVYTGGNGLDTIRNMDFMANAGDGVNDEVLVDVTGNVITSVNVNGSNVSIGLNGDASDNLTILNARGQHFKFNDLVAKVDSVVAYDGYTDCYVGVGNNPTVRVAANMGDVAIWLSGEDTMYLGDIAAINASAATGNNTLSGNDVNNLIVGGSGKNSIWGGEFATNDTLVGGSGQNTFFFQYANGHDVIQNAHDGDVVELVALTLDNIASTAITGNGVSIDLKDGSRLEVQSAANVEYKLSDGTSYTADHTAREWRQK